MDRAMAEDAPVEVRLALAKAELLRSKLAIVERRLKRAAIRAPIDGVVVEGDLRSRVGGVFTLGEPLVTVAPLDEWLLELEVPQSAVGDVVVAGRDAPDVHGAFSSYARPDHQRSFQLSRLLPAGRPAQGRTVYVAEARIAASGDGLRPGMEGVARIDIGRRRVWWVWLHGAIDYLRMKLWL
jgi:multidrug efflux pump subunit AcrA (membrane-fusion protein)